MIRPLTYRSVRVHSDLGAGLRSARERQRLTLRGVAGAVGISPSLLSQVETGRTQPSVSTLYALVNHLGVSLDDLMGTHPVSKMPAESRLPELEHAASAANEFIQRAEDNPVIDMESGVRWERLAMGTGTMVDPLITTYAPGGSSSLDGRFMRHSGIEYGYLLSGELTVKVDFASHILRAGDSLCFDSDRPHLYVNHTDREAKGLWFVVGRGGQARHGEDPHRPDRPA
jgi:transcriptional regulator with XRE-family HTH domain